MTHAELERRVLFLSRYAAGLTLAFAALLLTAAGPAASAWFDRLEAGVVTADTLRAEVVLAERVDVVQADGTTAVVMANGDRIPGPVWRGEEFSPEISVARRGASGLVFYNADGTESGGLIHRTVRTPDGYHAVGAITFDQFEQDQVVAMGYSDDGTSRSAGVQVWDQSTRRTIKDVIDTVLDMQSDDPEVRAAAEARQRAAEASGDAFGPQRVFVGSIDRSAYVTLQDTRGQARIRLVVDSTDAARIEMMDAAGRVVHRIPEE